MAKHEWKYEKPIKVGYKKVITTRTRKGSLSGNTAYAIHKTRIHEPDGKLGKVVSVSSQYNRIKRFNDDA